MDELPRVWIEVEIEKPLLDFARRAKLDLSEVMDKAVRRTLGTGVLEKHPRICRPSRKAAASVIRRNRAFEKHSHEQPLLPVPWLNEK